MLGWWAGFWSQWIPTPPVTQPPARRIAVVARELRRVVPLPGLPRVSTASEDRVARCPTEVRTVVLSRGPRRVVVMPQPESSMSSFLQWPDKGPDETLDYAIDWSLRLPADDQTISDSTWTVPAGITKTNQGVIGTESIAWLSGGTSGTTYQVKNVITTAGGRTLEAFVTIKVA